MGQTMRAGQLVEIGRVEYVEAPIDPPQPGELLVASRFSSICGSDLHGVQYGVELPPGPWAPGYPGHEGIGHVVQSRAEGFAEGDLVLAVPNAAIGRCMAEYQRLQAVTAVKLDRTLDLPLEEVLMAQQLGTVIFALRRYPTDVAGKTVVILGQGSAGLFFCHLLKAAGAARIIVADLSAHRLALSPGFGADVRLQAGVDDVRAAVMDLTGGVGADYTVEAVGTRTTLAQSIELAAVDSKLLWFGLPDAKEPVPISFQKFFRKRLTAQTVYGAQQEAGLVSFRVALDMIARRTINVRPLLSHILPIEQVGHAFELAHSREDGAVKVSVKF
ncbi:MAG: zinc-binding dehydrogenase [Acidimicrobiales bacterium]